MIIDVSSCMYVRRVRAHVTHVTRDSVNEKVREMILKGVQRESGRKGKMQGQMEVSENHFSRILFSLRIHFYLYNCVY